MYCKSSANGYCQTRGKMVKNKRDLKSPRRRSLLTRPAVRKPSGSNSANIKVVVRVRPPNEKETGTSGRTIIRIVNDQLLIFDPEEDEQPFFYHGVQQKGRDLLKKQKKNMQFLFDRVFNYKSNNHDVFQESTELLIDKLMEGCNCSVFVYGATGAGKTHTMLGHSEQPGITFLTMKALFDRKTVLLDDRDFELAVTYLEVYNENVHDLLNPGVPLHLREDGKFGVIVAGIKMMMIDSSEQLFQLLEQGNRNRTQHPTDANAESSRSHAVFQVYIRMKSKITQEIHLAKLSMIDLAGSERGAATGCAGQRFKEGSNINKSLLALGNCINSLADGKGHVPYRDSKLTRLLKDSLGGNCQTIMIANISPSILTYEDTYNTLKYATRAMKIKSYVRKNVVAKDVNVEQYLNMINSLKAEIEQLKAEKETVVQPEATTSCCNCKVNVQDESKLLELVEELTKVLERLHQLEMLEYTLDLRKLKKEEVDARLSDFISNTPDKVKGHKRLGGVVDRITKQASTLKDEIFHIQENKIKLYKQLDEFLEDKPHLKMISKVKKTELEKLEAQHKMEFYLKKYEKSETERKCEGDFTQKMSTLLRTCYLQLKGQNRLSESVEKAYKTLVNDWQGIRQVTFEDNPANETVVLWTEKDDNRKRKLQENESSCSLDSTFSMTSKPRPPLPVCAKQLLTKERCAPPKKVAKISPRKENKPKPSAAMGLSQRFPTAKSATPTQIRRPLTARK